MDVPISVKHLSKTYCIPVRKPGVLASLGSLVKPQRQEVPAVRDISFQVEPGEIVGFIGPNGAGKTTTLKMLAGLLYPSSGQVDVGGYVPFRRQRDFLAQISLVMGNKNQLTWENTVQDCFHIHKEIYQVSGEDYRRRLAELVELLDIEELLPKQARNLSLGERAKCQLAMALLHRPGVLFLDEPTLGLDVSMQLRFREFLRDYCRRHRTTVLLTSHYMGDIVSLCPRVILINQGVLAYDGDLQTMAERTSPFKLLKVSSSADANVIDTPLIVSLANLAPIVEENPRSITLRLPKAKVVSVITRILSEHPMADINISDPPIEAVIDQIYQGGVI